MARTRVDVIRALGWEWPPHPRITDDSIAADGTIDLDDVRERLQSELALHRRERDEMYAFAARWNAPVDDVTDRRDEVAGAIGGCEQALSAVREIADAVATNRHKPAPRPYVEPEYTEQERAAIEDHYRLPTASEVRPLLDTYFIGPFDEDMVERAVREVAGADALKDLLRAKLQGLFPLQDHRGQLWAERVWNNTRTDWSGQTLALFALARMQDGPRPRAYCPEQLVGTWTGTQTWTLAADGTATIDGRTGSWTVHVRGSGDVLIGSDIAIGKRTFTMNRLTTTHMELSYSGLFGRSEKLVLERAAAPVDIALGAVLAQRYRLERLIAPGTHGPVYEASVLDGGHPAPRVVIRVIAALDASQKARVEELARYRFRSSYQAEQHVADIEWRCEPGDVALHVMENLAGQPTLEQVLAREGALPIARACKIAAQLADAVHGAHGRHASLRPSVIYLFPRDHVKVIDFGLADIVADPKRTTQGPPPARDVITYMAPERLRGSNEPSLLDEYSIGAILFAMLAPHAPAELVALVEQAMHADTSKRPPAFKLAEALRTFT